MKSLFLKISLIALIVLLGKASFAQQNSKEEKVVKVAKFKPPKVVSLLGVNSNGATVTIDEANQLISLPLKVIDSSKNNYTLDSYGFLYKRKGLVEDDNGKKQVVYTTVADKFDKSPLPKIWIDNIQNGFQSSEELYFFDIVVKDKMGRRFFAPDLKLTIQ